MSDTQTFSIYTLEVGPMANFIYLIHDHHSKQIAVVDPAWEIAKVITLAQKLNGQITDILLSHSHDDHTNGLSEILNYCPAQVHLLKVEAQFWGYRSKISTLHEEGDIIQLGKTQIKVWHTPGHSPGSACYYLDGHIMTGDTLFVFGCGRCDLNGGEPEKMYHSLKRLSQLPPETIIYPGHHYGHQATSTIAEQIEGNPFLHFDNVTDFVQYRMHGHNRQTPYTPIKRTATL